MSPMALLVVTFVAGVCVGVGIMGVAINITMRRHYERLSEIDGWPRYD